MDKNAVRTEARNISVILEDRIEKLENDLEKSHEILEMLVEVVAKMYDGPKIVQSGSLEVDLEETKPAPFTGTPYSDNDPED